MSLPVDLESAMSEENPVQLAAEPVHLEIEHGTVIVENHWVKPEGAEYLEMVQRSKDMLELRMAPYDILPHSCLLAFFWLLLLGLSVSLPIAAPAIAEGLEKSGNVVGFLSCTMVIVLLVWAVFDGIYKYINCHFYFDRGNGQIWLGAFPNSPCFALSDILAIQLLERNRPKGERSLQLNIVLTTQGPSTQRINLQSGKDGIRGWPKCLEVMRHNSNRLAEFLDVPLIEQHVPEPAPLVEKNPLDAKEVEKLNGTWLLIEADGRAVAREELVRTMVRRGGGFRVKRGQDITLQGGFIIDPAHEPRRIDITPNTGRDRGKTYQGIYSLEEDIYKECFAQVGQPRPTEFQFQPGINRLRVYKRIK